MPKRYLNYPAILVDSKKFRIRIYKHTLHALGDPKYFLLIISPFDQAITITQSVKSDQRAYCIERSKLDNHRSPEIFNRPLVRNLYAICDFWDRKLSYRIYGNPSPDGSSITFRMADSTVFLGEQEWQ